MSSAQFTGLEPERVVTSASTSTSSHPRSRRHSHSQPSLSTTVRAPTASNRNCRLYGGTILPTSPITLTIIWIFIAFLITWGLYLRSPLASSSLRMGIGVGLGAGERLSVEAGTIRWHACVPLVENVDCANVLVPKDYFNSSAGTSSIAMAIWRANTTTLNGETKRKKGSVFLNPGGPGNPSTPLTLHTGRSFAKLIGEEWDLIGMDVRGVGGSRPLTKCFPSSSNQSYNTFVRGTVLEQGITISSIANLSDLSAAQTPASFITLLYNEILPQNIRLLDLQRVKGDMCAMNMGEELKYMGTASVVRDIEFISRVLDGDEARINYWGQSYGSVIGAYLVNMFPHRVGRVVIDGIVDPVSWSGQPSHYWPANWLRDAEKTYEWFLKDCAEAGPTLCPLLRHVDTSVYPSNSSALTDISELNLWQRIEQRLEQFLDDLARSPMTVHRTQGNGDGEESVLTSGGARGYLHIYLQNPQRWAEAAGVYADAIAGNATRLYDHLVWHYTPRGINEEEGERDLARLAVTCLDAPPLGLNTTSKVSDGVWPAPTAEDLTRVEIDTLRNVSRHFGASLGVSEPDGGCQFWPVPGVSGGIKRVQSGGAPERFTGPWNASLGLDKDGINNRKLLVISNRADPVTPLASGLLVNNLMNDFSSIIVQDGPGHCSLALPSLCTARIVHNYFSRESVPENGTVCAVDVPTFVSLDFDWDSNIHEIEGGLGAESASADSNTAYEKAEWEARWREMSTEDRGLIRAMRDIRRGREGYA